VLLRLSVDIDQVTKELFSSLVLQIVRWMSRSLEYENPDTTAVLNACFEAAATDSGPVRLFFKFI
jgi:DNA-dependent protein kinase catalytic subunit